VTYVEFLAIFLGIPVIAGVWITRGIGRPLILTLAGISILALIYTAPWDNLIVINGVWSYGTHRVAGVILGHIPLEEYVFYVLQVIMTGTLTAALLRRR
jgi:lycopene cyclase domain-containing protein